MLTPKAYADDELIAAITNQTDTDRAIAYLYRTYYRPLERYVLTNSGNTMDAEDLVQEVMVAFVDIVQQGKYRGEASVKSFLYTMARNLWVTELRKRGAEARRNEWFERERDSASKDVADYLAYHEAEQVVAELFKRMGETCRMILTLFYFDELPMKEILKQTNYENEQVLRNRKYRCLKEIANTIQRTPGVYETVKSALERIR